MAGAHHPAGGDASQHALGGGAMQATLGAGYKRADALDIFSVATQPFVRAPNLPAWKCDRWEIQNQKCTDSPDKSDQLDLAHLASLSFRQVRILSSRTRQACSINTWRSTPACDTAVWALAPKHRQKTFGVRVSNELWGLLHHHVNEWHCPSG